MPNRIIREGILTSERVNQIAATPEVEVFYRRLQSVVDDFGRYWASTALLRAALYPLCLDRVGEALISEYVVACQKARLLVVYEVDGKTYLEISDFRQRTRANTSKFPAPEGRVTVIDTQATVISQTRDGHMTASVENKGDRQLTVIGPSDDGHTRTETESESEAINTSSPDGDALEKHKLLAKLQAGWFEDFWSGYWRKRGREAALKAFRKRCKTEDQAKQLIVARDKQAAYYLAKDEEYRPHAATWLNQLRDADDEQSATAVSKQTTTEPFKEFVPAWRKTEGVA